MSPAKLDSASLWAATADVGPTAYPPLEGDLTADVAIIGAGFTGLSAALELADAGRSVVVLEAETVGFGASGRNGGQVNPGLKYGEAEFVAKFGEAGRAFFRMGEEAPGFLEDLIARKGLRCGYERAGLIRLAHSEEALASLRRAGTALRRAGVGAIDLDQEAVIQRVGTRRYRGGLFDPRGASIRPLDLARELARAAKDAGAFIHEGSPVQSLRRIGGDWQLRLPNATVRAHEVVVATNGYTDELVPGLSASLLPVNSFQIATEPLPLGLADTILPAGETVYDSRRLVLYFRKDRANRLILGGRASFSSAQGVARVPDYGVLESVLTGIFPTLAETTITHRWTGLVCITRDRLPHYHRPDEGLHALVGYNGRGVALSHRAGTWMARTILDRADSVAIPPTPISRIPFHTYRAPMLNIAMQWHRLLDLAGR